MDKDMVSLLKSFLLQASQLACIENAGKTGDVLCAMERLFRYWTEKDGMVPLDDEMKAAQDLISVLQLNTSRTIELECTEDLPGIFVQSGCVLNYMCDVIPPDVPQDLIGCHYLIRVACLENTHQLEVTIEMTTRVNRVLVYSKRVHE